MNHHGGNDMTMIAGYKNTLPYSIVAAKKITKFEQHKGTKAAISKIRMETHRWQQSNTAMATIST
jgi:hypothetical protein